MRSTLDYDELEDEEQEQETRDFTLGAPALLGIFFVIAIACAMFFGWGYSSSHNIHLPGLHPAPSAPEPMASEPKAAPEQQQPALSTDSSDQASAANSVTVPDAPAPTKPAPGVTASQGSDVAQPSAHSNDTPQTSRASSATAPVTEKPSRSAAAAAATAAAIPQPARSAAPSANVAAANPPATAAAVAGAGVMIQVAAVAHPADAQKMVAALHAHGFSAVARTLPTDHFLHVQVGPLASRDAARIMRGRLIEAGYPNAYIRP